MQLSRNCRAALAALIVALAPALAFAAIDPLKDAIGLAKVGRYSEAQSAFQRLADEAANHPTALVLILLARADAYFAAGEFGRSQSALDAARALPLPLSEALASRARALAAKLKEKLAFQQVSGFVTVATVHDARVRHRVTTLSGGVELVEVCDDFLSFDDDDDDSAAFDQSSNCFVEEVTTVPQARRVTRNISDWQIQTKSKIDHRLALDQQGSAWRSIVEFAEGWQIEASDRNKRAIRVRSGPSWFIPPLQTRFDVGAIYENNRSAHVTNLEYYAPFTGIETKLRPDLTLTANYRHETRYATPAEISGHTHVGDLTLRWDGEQNRLTGRILWRKQNTQDEFNSYNAPELRAIYRRRLGWFGFEGTFAEVEGRLRFTHYLTPGPNDDGVFRNDLSRTAIAVLGCEFDRSWTLRTSYQYFSVSSTIERFARQNSRVVFSATRNF